MASRGCYKVRDAIVFLPMFMISSELSLSDLSNIVMKLCEKQT